MASRDVRAATDERGVRAANARRNHRRARLQREQTDARQSGFEPSTHAERPFGKDADGVAVRERAERATERADVRPREVERDRADVAMQHRMHHSNEDARTKYRASFEASSFETLFAGEVIADLLQLVRG